MKPFRRPDGVPKRRNQQSRHSRFSCRPATFVGNTLPSKRRRDLYFESLEDRRLLAVLTVDTASDAHALNASSSPEINAKGDISLRSAAEYLTATGQAGAITFDMSKVTSPIDLTLGEIEVGEGTAVNGPGAGVLAVTQTGDRSVFAVGAPGA